MSKNRDKKHTKQKHDREAHHQEVVEKEQSASERVLVETPKGSSRLRFMLNLGLVIFLLLIFSITGPMMSALTGDGTSGEDVFVSWKLPGGEQRTLSIRDFYIEKRNLKMLEPLFPFLLMAPDTKPEDDENVARFLIMEDLARLAGVSAAGEEMSELILNLFGTSDNYRMFVARQGRDVTPAMFEAVLQRGLAYRRYRSLMATAVGEVDPEEVVVQWKETNQEYRFQYVTLEATAFEEEAKGQVPDVEVLQDWFDALPTYQTREFNTDESWGADLAFFAIDAETLPQTLLDRFPPVEGSDPELAARDYYNSLSYVRFVRPEEEVDDESETDGTETDGTDTDASETDDPDAGEPDAPAEETDPEGDAEAPTEDDDTEGDTEGEDTIEPEPEEPEVDDRFYPYEEVAEAARREAPVYNAFVAWLADINRRVAEGEAVDLETEAISMGLSYERVDPRTATAWTEGTEAWAGERLVSAMRGVEEGSFSRWIAVEEGGFAVGRITERRPPSLPPFEEIRERVAEKWAVERSSEIALERLQAIRETFREPADEEPADGSEESPDENAEETPDESAEETPDENAEETPDENAEETPDENVEEEEAEDEPFLPVTELEALRSAVEAAGYELVDRDYQPRNPGVGYDYASETPADRYLRTTSLLFSLEDGQLPEPQTSRDLKNAFLVRYDSQRDPSLESMGPFELTSEGGMMARTAAQEFFTATFDNPEWVAKTYLLKFADPPAPEEPEAPAE